ncbi:MAG: N-acetylmuramoyl-L-alanine amidase [Eubacterium sp.]|nr:N-acetylmuramoyl-L-alanine amidase [Eubacterium sp.]
MGMVLLLFVTIIALSMGNLFSQKKMGKEAKPTDRKTIKKNGFCVVIDPGHGGDDPGKVGTDGTLEKDLNLQIGKRLKSRLEERGYEVYLTRTEDVHLGSVKFRKITDLNERCEIIRNCCEKNKKSIMISIHQNSFPKENVKGAQCFYYHLSEDGKKIAEYVQKRLNEHVNGDGEKQMKRNDNYYILMNSDCPGVIIECGFLSNPLEEKQLREEEHQNLLAESIVQGIDEFFRKRSDLTGDEPK